MPSVIIPNTTRNEDYVTSRNISGKLKIVNPAVLFRAFVKCYQEYLQTKTSHDFENKFTNTRITFVVFKGLDTQFLENSRCKIHNYFMKPKAEEVKFSFHNLQRNDCADIIMETLYGINVFHSRKASNIQLLSSWVGTIFGPF